MEGLVIPAWVLIVEVGPVPPVPAHELQLCHPDIAWIALLTVWAVAEEAEKDVRRKPVSAAMEIEKQFLWDFIILLFSTEFVNARLIPGVQRRYRHIYSGSTFFSVGEQKSGAKGY